MNQMIRQNNILDTTVINALYEKEQRRKRMNTKHDFTAKREGKIKVPYKREKLNI